MGVQVDPVGQESPLRIQVDSEGGTSLAVANASEVRTSRVKDSILDKRKQ